MVDARLLIDEPVGETRRVLVDDNDRAFRIEIERWSERARRALFDEVWAARLVERSEDGDWQVDLGGAGQGRLRARDTRKLVAGARVAVRVQAEAYADKSAVVQIVPYDGAIGDKAQRLAEASSDTFLDGVSVTETATGPSTRPLIDAAIEEGLTNLVCLPGGGQIRVEATHALTAIDVDRAASRMAVHELNLAAAEASARQIALRGLGGLVVVDFIGAPRKAAAAQLADLLVAEAQKLTGARIDSLGLSRFGLWQAAVSRGRRSLAAAISCPQEEREALDVLRGIEDLGLSHRGARIGARMSVAAERWLRSDLPGWEAALAERIGPRWRLVAEDRPVGAAEIRIQE